MDILNLIGNVVSRTELQALAYAVSANIILGLVRAIVKKEFQLARLADFGMTIVWAFGIYLGVALASVAMADFKYLRDAAWVAIMAGIAVKVKDNLKDIGLPIPEGINRLFNRPPA